MVFSFFNKNAEDKTLVLLVDIGSASVGCALVKRKEGEVSQILATTRTELHFQESLSSAKFLFAMNHALERALKVMQVKTKEISLDKRNEGSVSPAYIFCTLSSPWFILKNRHIQLVRDNPFEINREMLDDLLNKDIELLKEEIKETLPLKDIVVIEKKIIQMKLNGYEIKNPYGQKTAQVDIIMNVGISSGKVVQSIEQKISQFFHSPLIHFGAFPVAAFSAIRDIFPSEKSFIFLDITGEATDVSFSANDILMETMSFPYGKNFFIRKLSTSLHTPHEEASTLFSMFLRKELPQDQQVLVEKSIADTGKEWSIRFGKSISMLSRNGVIPRKVFFTTDIDLASFFLSLISKEKTEFLLNESFDVQYINQPLVANFISFSPEVSRDSFLVIEALLVEKLIPQSQL